MDQKETSGFSKSLDAFSSSLYHNLVYLNPDKNLICSPLSIQTCAGMLRMGADEGSETAKELDEGLKFNSSNIHEIANGFHNMLTSYQECKILQMANKVYIMRGYKIRQDFNDTLTQNFYSQPEDIDFSESNMAANTINSWVESKTNNLIKNLVSPNVLNADTRVVLVNAIHFKGEWSIKFDENATHAENFYLDNENKVKVCMMNATNNYHFADLPDFDAKALRLAYRDSDLCMLIILPNKKTGLKDLEQKLQSTALENLTSLLAEREVFLKLPKFKAEFEQELTPVFLYLGIERIFTDDAEFRNMLESNQQIKVSEILHKAFVEVNEVGTEAAAATAMVMMYMSIKISEPEPELFHANHPFYYTIYDKNHCRLFVGNLKTPLDVSVLKEKQAHCLCNRESQNYVNETMPK